MLVYIQRHILSRKLVKIEKHAMSKKAWGNNITTMVVINHVMKNHYDNLFNNDKFSEIVSSKAIKSAFNNIEEMIEWLKDVRHVFSEVVNNGLRELPKDMQHLNVTELKDVNISDFVRNNNGYNHDILVMTTTMNRLIDEINNLYEIMDYNKRMYFNMRLSNGINTVLVFHEHLLEAMING